MFREEGSGPVGSPQNVPGLREVLARYARVWVVTKKNFLGSAKVSGAISFMLCAMDDLIVAAMEAAISGPDKKATVLEALGRLYDFIAPDILPIWAKPFSVPLRNFLINVLLSVAIDWTVAKYKESHWRRPKSGKFWDGKYVPCAKCRR